MRKTVDNLLQSTSNRHLNGQKYQQCLQFKQKQNKKSMSKDSVLSQIKSVVERTKQQDPDFVELDLSGITISNFTPQICKLIQKHKNIQVFFLTGCGLKTIEGFPKCGFVAIDLSDNELNDNSKLQTLTQFPNLSQILASNNKITKLETILKLKTLSNLTEVDFEQNPVSSLPDYRKQIFENFPSIEIVDRLNQEGVNVQELQQQLNDEEDDDDDDDEDADEDGDFDQDDDQGQEEDQEDSPQPAPKKKK